MCFKLHLKKKIICHRHCYLTVPCVGDVNVLSSCDMTGEVSSDLFCFCRVWEVFGCLCALMSRIWPKP